MKLLHLLLASISLITVAATGCNSDIFIDGPDIPETQYGSIDGDGGEATFTMPVRDLEYFGFDHMSDKNCRYYDSAGEEIDPKSPAAEIARIVYETDFAKIELLRNGSKVIVRSICSTYQMEDHWSVRFEYSYGVRFIEIEIHPGRPLQFKGAFYTGPLKVNDRAQTTSHSLNVSNDAPLPTSVTVMPYLNELASILVKPDRAYSWVGGLQLTMPVPVYIGGEWRLTEKAGIRPDAKYSYEGPDRMTKVEVSVPASSSVRIITDVIYTGAEAAGQMVFYNEILDRRIVENFSVTSLYPIKYEIRTEDAK